MIKRIKLFFNKHRFFLIVFAALFLYHILVVRRAQWFGVDEMNYSFHAVDYSMGFCSRMLAGSLYHWIVGVYKPEAVSIYVLVLYALFFLMLAYMLEKFYLAFQNNRHACIVFIIFFLVGPFSFSIFIDQFGMLDFYWAFFFLICCMLLQNKVLKFLIPVFAAAMIMVHYGSLVSYVPMLVLIILLYFDKAQTKKEKTQYMLIAVFTVVICGGLTLYFIKNDANNMVYSYEEFRHIVQDVRKAPSFYYDYYFFKKVAFVAEDYPELYKMFSDMNLVGQQGGNVFANILQQIKMNTYMSDLPNAFMYVGVCIGAQVLLSGILIGYFKAHKEPLKRLIVLAMMVLTFIMSWIGVLFSTDYARWAGHAFMLLFVGVFYVLYSGYREGMKKIHTFFLKIGYPFVYMVLFIYFGTVMIPYIFMAKSILLREVGEIVTK